MNREALDEFFARADDVLDDWHGSTDAMAYRADGEGEPNAADSYYDQWERSPALVRGGSPAALAIAAALSDPAARAVLEARMNEAVRPVVEALTYMCRHVGEALRPWVDALEKAGALPASRPELSRERALWLRQHRNTGPAARVGLDGHHRG